MRVIDVETQPQPDVSGGGPPGMRSDEQSAHSAVQRPGLPPAPRANPNRAWFGSTLHRAIVLIMVVASFGWNWKFKGPVLAGDRIGVAVRVIGKRVSSKGQPLVNLGFSVTKQDGTEVQAGETTLLGRFRPKGAA